MWKHNYVRNGNSKRVISQRILRALQCCHMLTISSNMSEHNGYMRLLPITFNDCVDENQNGLDCMFRCGRLYVIISAVHKILKYV